MPRSAVQHTVVRNSEENAENDATPGTKVDVYRNLQKGGLSIRSRETESYGLVIDHREGVVLENVNFVVNESGRQKVLEENVKNVHAFARGIIAETMEINSEGVEVTYNPYEYDSFVSKETERRIDTADVVVLCSEGVFAHGIEYKE